MKPLTDAKPVQRNTVLVAMRYLKVLCPQISLNGIRAFLYIAENPGINIVELSQVSEFTLSTASRIARALGPVGVEGSLPPYLGLIDIFINPDYAGGRVLYLSERGRHACLKLDAIIRTPVAIFGSAGCLECVPASKNDPGSGISASKDGSDGCCQTNCTGW